METRKQAIIEALRNWIAQRPGMDPRDYGPGGYRAESRRVARDKREAMTLLRAVDGNDGIDADALIRASQSAFSGRLTIKLEDRFEGRIAHKATLPDVRYVAKIEYCTGQYWPTEYRAAVCAVLASALWEWTREHAMPSGADRCKPDNACPSEFLYRFGPDPNNWLSPGDWLRAHFAREFGRGIASRWFQ